MMKKNNGKTISINFAPLGDTLKAQLVLQDFTCDGNSLEKFEKLRSAINLLWFHGYITDLEKDKKFQKLFNNIKAKVKLSK